MISHHENLYMPGCIRTNSGLYFDILNPHPSMINIEDIAHSLAAQPRWNGHTQYPFTIAQHSVVCANIVADKFKLAALLHDAAEAYIGDIPKPVKDIIAKSTGVLDMIEEQILYQIFVKFGVKFSDIPQEVKIADKRCLESEWKEYMLIGADGSKSDGGKKAFLKMFYKLTENKSSMFVKPGR